MEAEEREKLLGQSNLLRQELKLWEREFAAANGGRKAGRDDIKQHLAIAQKYKDYNRSRDVLSGKIIPQAPSSSQRGISRKRKQQISQAQTPSKRLQITTTPSKTMTHPAIVDPYDSPSLIRNLFTPSHNRVFGPTPQKDGQVLGLFDLLSTEDEESPYKGRITVTKPDGKTQATPHKTDAGEGGTIRHSRTPASSGKRFMLDTFATPLRKRHPNEQAGKSPSSVSKLRFSTPSFLRRDSHRNIMPPIEETADGLIVSPQMVRLPNKPLVRGLSSLLAGLRKMEEEAADDDLEALREMEAETNPTSKTGVLVGDSQQHGLLGGFDDEATYDSEPEEIRNPPLGRDGAPLKVWKKKGQKRTTRRVTMKPVRSKPHTAEQAQAQAQGRAPSPEDEVPLPEQAETETVPEAQRRDAFYNADDAGNFDSDSASEYTASEGGTRYRRPNQSKKSRKPKTNTFAGGDGKGPKEEGNGRVKTVARKVGALAHANFKRLKLRNSGSKGGVAHNSRFRRKR